MDSERQELEQLIEDWNSSRLDIFAISRPDDNLEFYGVMRFYFQEPGAKDRKVATKCIRVNSSDTTEEVMKVLVSKFHPDMKMLTMPNYSLYEVHETGAEVHKLEPDQRPLYVQLYWQQSDRDGRFLLKSEDDQMTSQSLFDTDDIDPSSNFQRRLSKREKKELKKKRRELARRGASEDTNKDGSAIAKELYDDRPSSLLTRSLSNPEAVMRLRRKKRLEEKLQQYKDPEKNGGGGGPLRIFAESLQPEIPYKTLLFSSDDSTETVLKTALEKYEVPPEEMDLYCLTMVTIAPGNHSDAESSGVKERVVPDKDCPVAIAASWPENSGELRFYLKKKENMPKRKRVPPKRQDDAHARSGHQPSSPAHDYSPPPVKETTFGVTETAVEKEPVSSPAVHVVDTARDLPATLEFRESGEDAFFAVVVSEVNGSAVHFKLAPTYTLYMCCRYRLSPKFRPDFSPSKRHEKVALTAKKVANMMWQTVKENNGMAGHLAFWMANCSEFLHYLKQDVDLSGITEESQKILAHTTQQAFRSLVQCIKQELQLCLPAFLDPSDESSFEESVENETGEEKFDPNEGYLSTERSFRVKNYGPHGQPLGGDQWLGKRRKASHPVLGDVLHTLSSAMSLLRRCRVNAALTIQLFSQLFHYMNMWLFNRMVLEPQLRLCTRAWGVRLLERLARIQAWAEKLGLELAAECHLARVTQAAFLLQVPKQDSTAISSHCYKLNSLQLRQLLELYEPERDKPAIPLDVIDNAVAVAENTADSLARSEGQEVRLEEEPDLHLPFLLPDDGYSSEQIRGVPPGLREFLEPLIAPGLCRLTVQPKASGLWTVHFRSPSGEERPVKESSFERDVTKISINKGSKGMGVSIVAAKGLDQEHSGIYVKEIVAGGPADLNGRLKPGDQILDVNGESLVGVQQEDAVKYLLNSGSVVSMTISKSAVWKQGLSALLKKPATVNKAELTQRMSDSQDVAPVPVQRTQKEIPRAPPTYRASLESPQRSPPLDTSMLSENDALQPGKPEPRQKRPSPYKNPGRHVTGTEQVQAKAVVEYKLERKSYKAPVPYAAPQEIQLRQKEMQQRKIEDRRRDLDREIFDRDRSRREQEEREEKERMERDRGRREQQEREERERIHREELEQHERRERERKEWEKRERERVEREEKERREREQREQRERELREHRERELREQRERELREQRERELKEQRERELREQREREQRERELREQREREVREQREKEKRERHDLDDLSRRERELELKLEQKRREKERRLLELERQLEEEMAETERLERQYLDQMRRAREERMDQHRNTRPSEDQQRQPPPRPGNAQVHYVSEKGSSRDVGVRERPTKDYVNRAPVESQDSFEIDPAEVERQFQQRLALESGGNQVDGAPVTVIRVPVQQENWDSRGMPGNDRDAQTRQDPGADSRARVRYDWQRGEEMRSREQDAQLVRDYQQQYEGESYRQQPAGSGGDSYQQPAEQGGEHPYARQPDWRKEEELRRQREEDERLREARANQLRNRIIEKTEEDEEDRGAYTNGRTRRVKFASVRTEIIQPSPDAELSRAGVKFVHDGKVEDSDEEEEFPRPPPPVDDDVAPPHPPPPEDSNGYYQRPVLPPKPQFVTGNRVGEAPPDYPYYRDSKPGVSAPGVHSRISEEGTATYPGRQQNNNKYPVPKPRVPRSPDQFSKSPSPDQAKLPFKDKMKLFNETTPPKKQTSSRWEREQQQSWTNGGTL